MTINYILYYRFICLILALGYWLYQFTIANYDNFGIQFRYLTIWGLSTALASTTLLFINSLKGSEEQFFAFVSATAVLNSMVIFLYWKLYFIDPSLVNYSGSITWFQEYYLHLIGPILIIVDSLLINNSFRQFWRGILTALSICIIYILWSELITGPLNTTPNGKITTGLPYPFLNEMLFKERIIFYLTTIFTGLLFYMIGWFFYFLKSRIIKKKMYYK